MDYIIKQLYNDKLKKFSITGSQKLDLFLILIITLTIFIFNNRLKVYNTFTLAESKVYLVDSSGVKNVLQTPVSLQGQLIIFEPSKQSLKRLEDKVKYYVRKSGYIKNLLLSDPNSRLEWIVYYSNNNKKLDKKHKIIIDKDSI